MPQNISYPPIFDLIPLLRIDEYKIFLKPVATPKDYDLYGSYLWSQKAAASIYPLMQHLEILLRNSIDQEARRRFGDFWWNTVKTDNSNGNANNFKNGIDNAIRTLEKEWKQRERARLGLQPQDLISTPMPTFSHDKIIATTDFGTWKEILVNAHHAPNQAQNNFYLWPISMSKVFRKYSAFSTSPDQARLLILNAITEIRDYRNRLFHHDCIWVKKHSTDAQTAIDTIRHKINTIEKLIDCISPLTLEAIRKWGLIESAKTTCSIQNLQEHHLKTPALDEQSSSDQ